MASLWLIRLPRWLILHCENKCPFNNCTPMPAVASTRARRAMQGGLVVGTPLAIKSGLPSYPRQPIEMFISGQAGQPWKADRNLNCLESLTKCRQRERGSPNLKIQDPVSRVGHRVGRVRLRVRLCVWTGIYSVSWLSDNNRTHNRTEK